MNFDWVTSLLESGVSMYDTIAAAPPLLLYFSALALPIVAWFILHAYRNVARNVEAIFHIVVYRVSHAAGNWKTRIVCKLREWLPHRRRRAFEAAPEVEFDDLDIAVLRTAAALGPGFAVNAAELAARFRLRPAQVQRSLRKLSDNKMLDFVIGSDEGFDNYRLTQMGTAFMSNWQAGQQA